MTRLFCVGDIHLGAIDSYVDDPRSEEDRMLDQVVQIAYERQADLVLVAGDVFHRPRPAPNVLHVFQRFCTKLEAYSIPAIAVHGNLGHDLVNGDEPSALELFASDWLHVSRTPELVKAAGDVAVCCLPSVPVHRLVAAANGGDRALINEAAAEALLEVARGLYAQVPDGWPSILLGHWSVSGAALPNGLPTDDLHEPVLSLDGLEEIGFDAYIMGHIHRSQPLGDTGCYTGSPWVQNFGEAECEHGCWIVDLPETRRVNGAMMDYVALEGRRFVTIDCDLTDPVALAEIKELEIDETDIVAGSIAAQIGGLEGAVVRLRYRASEAQHRRVDLPALKGFIAEAGAHRLFQVAPDIVRSRTERGVEIDETLAPMTALDAYVESQSMEQSQGDALRMLLGRYLEAVA